MKRRPLLAALGLVLVFGLGVLAAGCGGASKTSPARTTSTAWTVQYQGSTAYFEPSKSSPRLFTVPDVERAFAAVGLPLGRARAGKGYHGEVARFYPGSALAISTGLVVVVFATRRDADRAATVSFTRFKYTSGRTRPILFSRVGANVYVFYKRQPAAVGRKLYRASVFLERR